jgi:hypothetical protein
VVALLAIGVSVGMLAERWRSGGSEEARPEPQGARSISRTPHMVPDQMPLPIPPPRRHSPADPILPPLPRSLPNPLGTPKNASPNQSQLSAERFASEVTDSLCSKLTQCGIIDNSTRSVCEIFASQLDDQEAAARVKTGECSFDERSAKQCIAAIDGLTCDFAAGGDMALDWLLTASSLQSCTSAYVCK